MLAGYFTLSVKSPVGGHILCLSCLLINASAFSSLQACRLYWVAMVRQDFGPKPDIRIYLSSFMGFKRNKTIAIALGVIQVLK